MKYLSPKYLPPDLWKDSALQLPDILHKPYWKLIQQHGLTDDALSTEDQGTVIGGPERNESLRHFCLRYGVSYCRVESLLVDPHEAFAHIPDDLLVKLSGGRVSVLDLACGTGAVGASLLCTITVLRNRNMIPKLPLIISLMGGDCSDIALSIYVEMIDMIRPFAESVGIEVELTTKKWIAEDSSTTSEMFDMLFEQKSSDEEYMVVVANFGGTLDQQYAQFNDSMAHIFARTSNKKCIVIWVESWMKSSRKIFDRIGNLLQRYSRWRAACEEPPFLYQYQWYHPYQNKKHDCRVTVKEYKKDSL